MQFPNDLKYTKDHEWARVEGQRVTVGITDHAQSSLGDIVYCELPDPGRSLKEHETFGVVESIKAVSDLYAPVAGKVVEVNSSVKDEPSKINADPYGDAWLMVIEVSDSSALEKMMDAKAYEAYVKSL